LIHQYQNQFKLKFNLNQTLNQLIMLDRIE